jgi:hypothetical protein
MRRAVVDPAVVVPDLTGMLARHMADGSCFQAREQAGVQ